MSTSKTEYRVGVHRIEGIGSQLTDDAAAGWDTVSCVPHFDRGNPSWGIVGYTVTQVRRGTLNVSNTVELIDRTLAVINELMPGIKHIAVKDYAEVNMVPIDLRKLRMQLKGE